MTVNSPAGPAAGGTSAIKRWLPLGIMLAAAGLIFAMGWHKALSFKSIGLNYDALRAFIDRNLAISIFAYVCLYAGIVALSLPGALFATLSGGLLFGWVLGAPATVVGATLGAVIIYFVAKTSLGEPMAARAGPWLGKLRAGFQENALSYLLFLRLVPAFPFVVVNLAAALLGVPFRTYVLATFFGIIPGTTAYSVAGAGLGSVIGAQNQSYRACLAKALSNPQAANPQAANLEAACPYTIDTSALVTRELVLAFALIGLVALIPPLVKKWRERNAAA